MRYTRKLLFSLMLSVLLSCSGVMTSFATEGVASTMQLAKTEGTVEISSSTGKEVPLIDNMRIYNGYSVETAAKSYAWVSLDDVKLTKLDAVSKASVRKHGKKLEILLDSGNIFFNVEKPLEEDESFYIRTSTMGVGIRGTSGWLEIVNEKEVQIYVLEGTTEVSVSDPVTGQVKTEKVSGGENARCVVYEQTKPGDKCDILRDKYSEEAVSGFVLTEVVSNPGLAESIFEKTSGDIDLRDVTQEEAKEQLKADNAETEKKLDQVESDVKAQEKTVSADPVWEVPGFEKKPAADKENKPASNPAPASSSDSGGSSSGSGGSSPSKPSTPVTKYTVTFDSQNDSAVKTVQVAEGKKVSKPTAPKKTGYTFVGWYKEPEGTTEWKFTSDTVTGDMTLYAKWEEVVKYSVQFLSSGGQAFVPIKVEKGQKITRPSDPTWAGHKFIGWYKDAACTTAWNFDRDTVTGDMTLYAKWEQVIEYSVTFNYNGSGVEMLETKVEQGQKITKPDDPTWAGHKFLGWYKEAACKTAWNFNTQADGDVTLYAKWESTSGGEITGEAGADATFTLSNGTLTISGTGAMHDYGFVSDDPEADPATPWFKYNADIKKVVVESGITRIGNNAFNQAPIDSVTIGSDVTSIGEWAFAQCNALTSVTIPDKVTAIEKHAFVYCENLKNVTIGNKVEELGNGAFSMCGELTTLNLPLSIKSIAGFAFNECNKISAVNYAGTETDWAKVNKASDSFLPDDKIVYKQ